MANIDSEDQVIERNRRTLFLLLAGAFALLIPLFVLLYLRMTDTSISLPNAGNRPFARRDPADRPRVAAAPAPQVPMTQVTSPAGTTPSAPTATTAGGSLGFIKGGSEYYPPDQAQQAPPPAKTEAEQPPPAPKEPVAKKEEKKPPAKTGPKPFMQPRLNTSLGNRSGGGGFSGRTQFGGQQGGMPQGGQAPPMPPGGMPDVSGMMKNMPGGGAGMPDVGSMLQGVTGGGEKKK